MERDAIKKLEEWKNRSQRKPMIIEGARQTGKTWLMREFGSRFFENTIYISFDSDKSLREIFSNITNTNRLLADLEIYAHCRIDPGKTLIIFDEIQECPAALTSLKYFQENAPQYYIIAAGSLLGLAHHQGTGFPVGKVEFMRLHPLSFLEFLTAAGEDKLRSRIENADIEKVEIFSEKLIHLLKQYCFTGGMPEVVDFFLESKNYDETRRLQNDILNTYALDFPKHAQASMAERIRAVWESTPSQLARENKKFVFKNVRKNAKNREYGAAILWLAHCGLAHIVKRITKPDMPLIAYEDQSSFKMYIVDTGLLGALSNLNPTILLNGSAIFEGFKGALVEQFVLQQLVSMDVNPVVYWTNGENKAEIDFVIQLDNDIIPIEVKASTNLRAKSLTIYRKKYQPRFSVRTSLAGYQINGDLHNIPLYLINALPKILAK